MHSELSTPPAMRYVIGFGIGSVGAALLGAGIWLALMCGLVGAVAAHFVSRG